MATNTTKLGLRKPGENDFYNQQTEQADNWDKVDKFADDIQNDVDATWGGMYGGYIQDVSAKVVGQRYIDKINGKAYECIKTGSNTNTTEFFSESTTKKSISRIKNIPVENRKGVTNANAFELDGKVFFSASIDTSSFSLQVGDVIAVLKNNKTYYPVGLIVVVFTDDIGGNIRTSTLGLRENGELYISSVAPANFKRASINFSAVIKEG